MSQARFQLFVKGATTKPEQTGDCPFSQRAYMFMLLKVPHDQIHITTVDITNKPAEFLAVNPGGKVPVLKDNEVNKIIDDSGAIVEYINSIFPEPDLKYGYQGQAVDCTAKIFPKLAALVKNQVPSVTPDLKSEISTELKKLNDYLVNEERQGRFLLGDSLSELDCSVLPKLNHVRVAGKAWKNYNIDESLTGVLKYLENGRNHDVWKKTCPQDIEIELGWGRHGILKED